MTTVLAVVVLGVPAAAVAMLLRQGRSAAAPGPFEAVAAEPAPATLSFVALGRIEALLRDLPDDAAQRELAALAGGEDRLREARS